MVDGVGVIIILHFLRQYTLKEVLFLFLFYYFGN